MAVVKADAYGHGLIPVARCLDEEKLRFFGVANVFEARRLFEAGVRTPVYILGATMPAERAEIAARGWTPCLCSFEELEGFASLGRKSRPVPVHLALDTGMGRGGFLPEQLGSLRDRLRGETGLRVTGLGSHMPVADEDDVFSQHQIRQFDDCVAALREISPNLVVHLPNSAGLLRYQSPASTLVRPGLMLYGISPLPEFQADLQPVMTLKSRVSLVHELPAGHGVSYGRTLLKKDTRAAVLGIGYGDGYPRHLSGTNVTVQIRGVSCPLLGRVTMDQIIVDGTAVPGLSPGDEATIFGKAPLVSEIARLAGTIPWEVLTQITPRVARQYRSR